MGLAIGAKWSMDQLVASHARSGPQGGTPLVNGASQSGASLVTDGWTGSGEPAQGGRHLHHRRRVRGEPRHQAVHRPSPAVRRDGGRLLGRLGQPDRGHLPEHRHLGHHADGSAAPADNAAITVLGGASTVGVSNVLFHKDAFTLACIPMQTYGGLDKSAVEYDPTPASRCASPRAWT
jgi:hypothetical protein